MIYPFICEWQLMRKWGTTRAKTAQKEKKRHILKGDKIISSVLESKYDYLKKNGSSFKQVEPTYWMPVFPFMCYKSQWFKKQSKLKPDNKP